MSTGESNFSDVTQPAASSRDGGAIPTPLAGSPTVNADNPWPGLLAFREADQEYFEGRRTESEDLFRLVMRERLTVFFGLSGLGKTSLLQAGLFPMVRRESLLPVYIRLDFSREKLDLGGQVKAAIVRQAEIADVEAPIPDPHESLWEYFHRQDSEFWTRRNRLVIPLIVFDQFEEIFTLGRLDTQGVRATDILLDQLAELVEGRPPAALKAWLDEHPDDARKFTFSRHHFKVLLSIREDFLPELEVLRQRMPSIALNRLRLQRMNGNAALAVIAKAKHLIDLQVAEKVVSFVAAGRSDEALDNLEVDPALLSVVCRELNRKRQILHEPKITENLLEGSRDQVLNDFYEGTVADLPVEVRSFIEERLLTVSGFRDSIALENALSLSGITRDAISQLVERRLLRREDRGGVQRLELTHDLLAGVVRTSRDRRHVQEEAEKGRLELLEEQRHKQLLLDQQIENEKKERAKRELRRTRRVAIILALMTIAAVAGLIGAIQSSFESRKSRSLAVAAASTAFSQRQIAEMAVNRIRQSLLIRQAALSGDQKKLNEAISKLDQNNRIQFAATATDLHYPDRGFEVYKFELFPQQATLPTAEDKVAFVTYLADSPAFENTLFIAGEKRSFRIFYIGWGCLNRIVALTEYAEPTKPPTVTVFDMCKLLGDGWEQGKFRKPNP